MQIAVLGAGAWGTALAQVVAENGHSVTLWTWLPEHADAIMRAGENQEFLSGTKLHPEMRVTADLEGALRGAELVVVVVPSQVVRKTMKRVRPHLGSETRLVCASKGIEEGTLALMTRVIAESIVDDPAQASEAEGRVGVISGPSFAREVALHVPTNLVAAAHHPDLAVLLQETFANAWLRVYTSHDPTGVEVGGALKNVIAIAAGACDGFGLGQNTRAALITRGIAEMGRLAAALGGQAITTAGLAGVGDLVLTCTGDLSRNRTLGFKLGQGMSLDEALSTSSGVAEGFFSTKSAHELALRVGVELPITEAVHAVLFENQTPASVLQRLLSRPLRPERE